MTYKLSQSQVKNIIKYINDSEPDDDLTYEESNQEIDKMDELCSIFTSILTVMELAKEDYVYIMTKKPSKLI